MRFVFGGAIADYTISKATISGTADVAVFSGGAVVTLWTAEVGGTQVTDLQDMSGGTISQVDANVDGDLPEFKGPDDGSTALWASANGGSRRKIFGDTGQTALQASQAAEAAGDAADAAQIAASTTFRVVEYTAGAWPVRPATSQICMWVGPSAPTIGGDYAIDGTDLWIQRDIP